MPHTTRHSTPPPDSLAAAFVYAARALGRVLDGHNVDDGIAAARQSPVRAQAQELAYGALRRHAAGRFLLDRLLQRPLVRSEVTGLLLCALYRLESRPDAVHTTVDQAVEAAGTLARGAFRGLVNGVLRSYLRQRPALLTALAADEEARWQHPRWWIRQLRSAYPDAWEKVLAAGNALPPMTLRVNCRHLTPAAYCSRLAAAGIEARVLEGAALQLRTPQAVDALPGFAEGWVSVQDAGAQRAALLLDVHPGLRVLDACAAPGGKTGHLLELCDLDLTALDADALRLRRVHENLERLGLPAQVRVADCAQPQDWWDGQPFDRILADVPCSASGVVRRHPDAKWLRRAADIGRFAARQRDMLDALWPLLAPGGKLLYATCSVFPAENSAQIAAFRQRVPQAVLEVEETLLPGDEHDGFYYARLLKPR